MFKVKIIGIFCLLITVFNAHAQTRVWHKELVRIIDLAPKEEEHIHRLTDVSNDTSLFETIIIAIKTHRLTAYDPDKGFNKELSFDSLKKILTVRADVDYIVDPITGATSEGNGTAIGYPDFNYCSVHKYKIMEDWAFDAGTGKTDVQITGIGPVKETYNEDGVLRGMQTMFWLRYNDMQNMIIRYEQYHPDNTIALHIWNDYFLSDVKPESQK